MTKEQISAVLAAVRTWPPEDQEELAEVAREIEARRQGAYVLDESERQSIAAARQSSLATDDEVAEFWRTRGIS